MEDPSMFFSIYSPPRSEAGYKSARARLEEDLKLTSRMVSYTIFRLAFNWLLYLQISNVCITLNEFPYIRYYIPPDHGPLGPLKPNTQNRPPPPPEASSRWRTNLARGAEARAYESVEGDFVTKLLAIMVQNNLEEYKKSNSEFAVCPSLVISLLQFLLLSRNQLTHRGHVLHC